jgi:hypothetical protein
LGRVAPFGDQTTPSGSPNGWSRLIDGMNTSSVSAASAAVLANVAS